MLSAGGAEVGADNGDVLGNEVPGSFELDDDLVSNEQVQSMQADVDAAVDDG